MPSWRVRLSRITRRIWFRAAVISVLSVMLALASAVLAPLISYEFSLKVGSDSVDSILTILASSMLAVTTFSLAAMVAAFSRAAQQVTPRATQLLIEDKGAQNALSTFLGAFLFAIVGIIALSTGIYGPQGRVILYAGTIVLIIWIAVILLRWIHTLTQFGRVEDAIRRIERATGEAINHFPGPILVGGETGPAAPDDAVEATSSATGYITVIDREALASCAKGASARVWILASAGELVARGQALAAVDRPIDDERLAAIAAAFQIEPQRSFDHDPRFGMVVLAEIGSRALSPAVNDPGTAIAALTAGQRLLEGAADKRADPTTGDPSVIEAGVPFDTMVAELVRPIARDGARIAEVGVRIQTLLGAVAQSVTEAAPAIHRLATEAYRRMDSAEADPVDKEMVRRAHREAFPHLIPE